MRKTLLGVMLAITTALPGIASAQAAGDAPQQREGRGQWRGNGEGRQGQYRAQQQAPAQQQQQQQQQQGRQWSGQRDGQASGWQRPQGSAPVAAPQQSDNRGPGQRFDGRGERRGGERQAGERRFDGNDGRGISVRSGSQWQRGFADRRDDARDQARFTDRAQWNRGWRGNDRYDYGGYRSGNRGAFHLPRYYAPRGWNQGYRRYGVGIRLSPLLFGQSYWIDDPYDYRLPPAYGPYRWVRYYNDALLVDIRSGDVVDTVYDIFW